MFSSLIDQAETELIPIFCNHLVRTLCGKLDIILLIL